MTPEDMAAQDRIYARSLAAFDPMVVNSATEEWSATKQFWPELSELLALCREHEALAEVARRPRLAPPESPPTRREDLSDGKILAAWAHNDRLAEEMQANPAAYFCAAALVPAFKRFRERRYAERPDLAARYYGEDAA